MSKYEIFKECFPELYMSDDIFYKLSKVDIIKNIEYKKGKLIGYALVEENELRLLCVLPEYQGRGIGSKLLKDAEAYIKSQGYNEVVIGGTSSRFFIGAPKKAVGFFEKCGFEITGDTDEMKRSIQNFNLEDFELTVNESVSFGWYEGSIEEIRATVAAVEEDWVRFYNEDSKIFCSWHNEDIASFCIVICGTECILSNNKIKVGEIGCVGTVPKYRRKGIGLRMIALASEELKKENCDECFIHYTGVPEWYGKLGYKTFLKIYFMRKKI